MLNGALFVFIATGLKAGIVGLIAVGVLMWRSANPLLALIQVLGLLVGVMAGGALSGAAFAWLGRPLLRRGGIASHIGSYVTLAPYMFVGAWLLTLGAPEPLSSADLMMYGFSFTVTTVLFGSFVLRSFFVELAVGDTSAPSQKVVARKRKKRPRTA